MKHERSAREIMLEVGIFVSLSIALAALGFVVLGRKVGGVARARRRKLRHPEPGFVDAARHQQVAVTSSR